MSKTYLLTFKPLDYYAFGTARQFSFKGRQATKDDFQPYFIRTSAFPEQSTLFGAIRYLVLKQHGCINPDFSYTKTEREQMAELVGDKSFSLLKTENQSFGKIQNMSPVFVIKESDNGKQILIPNPFNNCESEKPFRPIRLSEIPTKTNHGDLFLPLNEDYNPKKGYASGYYNICEGKAENDFIKTRVVTGNRVGSDEDGLFKKEVHQIEDGYTFAVYLTLDGDLSDDFVTMGIKSTVFQVKVEESENTLRESVKQHFNQYTPDNITWSYCLSDVLMKSKYQYKSFAIFEEKSVKQIATTWSEKQSLKAIQLQKEAIHLIKAGSIVYDDTLGEMDFSDKAEALGVSVAGYNHVIVFNKKGEN